MSDFDELVPTSWVIRRRWLPVLALVLGSSWMCVGVTGVYFGAAAAQSNWQKQKLEYEQRLGTQTAEYANNLHTFQDLLVPIASGLRQTQDDVKKLNEKVDGTNEKLDRASAKRDKQNGEAVRTAREAVEKAEALSAQLTQQQKVIVPKIDEAVSAAKETVKKIETAQRPTAAVPALPWAGNRRGN